MSFAARGNVKSVKTLCLAVENPRLVVAFVRVVVAFMCGFVSVRHVSGVRPTRGGQSFGTVAGGRSALWRAMTMRDKKLTSTHKKPTKSQTIATTPQIIARTSKNPAAFSRFALGLH